MFGLITSSMNFTKMGSSRKMVYLSIDSKSIAMKNGHGNSGSIRFPHLMFKHFGNFQKLHARIHHHRLHAGRSDLGFEFIENDMMNHEGKANRRFR